MQHNELTIETLKQEKENRKFFFLARAGQTFQEKLSENKEVNSD
jgi:hypothetical protein